MKKLLSSILLTCALLAVSLASNATIHYVYPGGSGSQDGTSWSNAAPDIQHLLTPSHFAVHLPSGPTIYPNYPVDYDTIFVAGGTYSSVWFHNGGCVYQGAIVESSNFCRLHIYGGFNGNETSLDQRLDWTSNPSIIDAQGDRAVWFEDMISHAGNVVFDGFIVKGAGRRKEAFRIVNTNAWISHVIVCNNIGIPFYLEHVPYYPNEDFYATTSLVDVIVKDNNGEGWPASLAVSAYSQFKIYNSTIVWNDCDSMWNNHPLSLYYSYANKSICKIYNSIVWKNGYGDRIIDATYGQYPPGLYYQNSIIEHISDPTSDWATYGHDMGNCADTDPMLQPDCSPQYGSPAIGFGDYQLYPYYQAYLLYLSHHPFAHWFYDVNNNDRFNFDFNSHTPLIDAGAIQYYKNSIDERIIIDWLNNTDIMGGNVISPIEYAPPVPPTNYVQSIPLITPTKVMVNQPIYIKNIANKYTVSVFDISGRIISQYSLSNDATISAPAQNGLYIVVATQEGKTCTKEIILVK